MAEDNTIKLVDDFVNYIRDKYKEHFITNFDSMFGPVEETEAGFNMFVKEDGTVLADRLYLKPESQKKGIGTSIVQEMFDWSNKNNQPFEFILMAGYEDLSSPSKTVQTQKAFQEKLKDVPGLEAFPSEQGLLDTNITTYKYAPQLDTPTNVVDDFVITQDRFGRDVTVPVDNNGNIILYRATDDPNRIIDSDFRPLSRDKGSVGLGQQSYFSPNPMYSHKYQSSGRKNYKFATQIKPNQILPTDDIVKNYPELVNALNIPEEFTNQNWRQLVNDNKAMIAMGYETGGKRFFNDNIQTFINNGIQAFGSGSTGTGGQTFIEYEIIPLVKEGDTLGIKPIATLQTKEGFEAGKVPEAFTETLLDTPTNVVDDIKATMIGYENQVEAFKNLDKNVIGELPVEKNSELFSQNILERPDNISYDEFIKNYPVEELGPIPFYEGKGDTLTPDDLLREQSGTGYQLKEGVTPEEFRKSLDNFIEQIDNPHIKEGLLSRYRKYDKLSEGIVDQTVKSRILGAVNQDVFYDVIAFNDDLYTTKKTEDMAIVFDGWTEPTPFEDMALAEMEDWDWVLDEQGNKVEPIDPRKNIQGMDKYDRTLNGYYKYYTDIPDTPTNVVDDAPLLETRFNYTSDVLDVPVGEIDEWADDVIKPNKVFNPDSFTRYTREGKEYIWNRTTSFDAKELYERILKNRASDEDITKFFIYLASHSPSTAYAHKPYFQADALSDIVKIGIFSDKPITEVIPMGVFRDEAFFLDRLQSRNSELGPEINKVLVELVTEQGQFTNLKERMRNVIIDAHNKIYKNNPNDYYVLWRGGKLNRFYPWQSMSKSPSSAQAVSYQMNQLYGAGDTVETYLIHKNNMIDLDALGLSFSNEQEIIVLAEAANKPSAKLEQVLIQDDVNRINVSDLPKNGFEIENISKPLADAGQASQDFFDDVVKGINEKYRPKSAYEQIIDLNNPDIYKWQDDYNKLVKEGGNFNQHIFTSIPTFYETQIIKGLALSNLLNKQPMPDNLLKGRYQVLDIGGTEGTWAKALAKNNPNFYVEVLDPLKKAQDVFEEGELVTNAIFRREAFSYVLDDQDKIFDAKAFQPVRFAVFNEVDKYDVVHESMAFQFMDKNRAEQIKFIKENLLNENGIIIIEEKFANNDAIYKANEELKNTFKSKYYTPEQLQDKKFNVLLDMEANQVSVQEIEKILGENFANVEQYWDAGNFKGYIASDSDVVNQFVPEINNLEVSLTNHRFSTAPTEKEIKVAVQNKMQQGGTDSKLAAQLAQETVAKNPKLYNTLAKTLTRFGVLGGTALAGLGKIAPALAPGDVAIEKAIEKAVPYLDAASSKLGFGRLKFGNILPTYIAYEIGVALADVAQAALYADSSAYKYREGGAVYNELRQPELDATGKPLKVLGMSAYDYFQTPPGKKQLEEFDFGSQFMNELDQEKISKYSPGWGLTKGLMFLIGEAYKSGTDQTTSDYTTKLKENPASIYNAGFTGSNK